MREGGGLHNPMQKFFAIMTTFLISVQWRKLSRSKGE